MIIITCFLAHLIAACLVFLLRLRCGLLCASLDHCLRWYFSVQFFVGHASSQYVERTELDRLNSVSKFHLRSDICYGSGDLLLNRKKKTA